MTNKFRSYREAEDIQKAAEQSRDSRPDIREKAKKTLKKHTITALKELIDGFDEQEYDSIPDEQKNFALRQYHESLINRDGREFQSNTQEHIDEIKPRSLEQLVRTRPIQINSEGKDNEAISKFREVLRAKDYKEHVAKGGGPRNDIERRYQILAAAQGMAKNQIKDLETKGYTIDQQALESLTIVAIQRNAVKEERLRHYEKEGMDKIEKEAKDEYKKVDRDIKDAVKTTLEKMGEEKDNTQEFRDAMYLTYLGSKYSESSLRKELDRVGLSDDSKAPQGGSRRETLTA